MGTLYLQAGYLRWPSEGVWTQCRFNPFQQRRFGVGPRHNVKINPALLEGLTPKQAAALKRKVFVERLNASEHASRMFIDEGSEIRRTRRLQI